VVYDEAAQSLMFSPAVFAWLSLVALLAPSGQILEVAPLPRDGQVLVSFKLGDAFTDEVESAVHSGLTVSFVYKVDLMRASATWFDRTLASTVVTATVRYDNLTRKYHMTRTLDGRIERAETTASKEFVRDWLTTVFERLPLFTSVSLQPNSEYYVRVRAHTTPRTAAFLWPWDGHDVVGLAKFTFLR
jgi:hypothetical protein